MRDQEAVAKLVAGIRGLGDLQKAREDANALWWLAVILDNSPSLRDKLAEVFEIYREDNKQEIKRSQHCTSSKCPWTFSHTAAWCGYEQPRRCRCAYCYPKEG